MSRCEEFVSIKYGSEKIPKQNYLLLVNLKELYEQFQWNNSEFSTEQLLATLTQN